MPNKDTSFWIESPTDKVVSLNGQAVFGQPACCGAGFVGGTFGGVAMTASCVNNDPGNPSSPLDLKLVFSNTITSISGVFKRSNGTTYPLSTHDFVTDFAGYHPKPRV